MEKQRWKESEKRREEEWRSEKRKRQKKEDAGARKGSKVANHCVFPMICGSGGLKSRLAKAAGAEPRGQMREEKLHAIVARSTVYVSWTHSGIRTQPLRHSCARSSTANPSSWKRNRTKRFWAVEKVHAVVARSTFWSQTSKKWRVRSTFGRSDVVLRGRRKGWCTLSKVSKRWGFVAVSSTSTTTLHYTYSGGPALRIWKTKIY